jgi:APA family basic amino acid/polyamine antiporter
MTTVATPHEGPSTSEPASAGFQQRLGLFDATMLVAGSMIGSGIFIVSSEIARDVGTSGWLMAVWVVAGVMTVLGALSYGELAAMMPHAGGQYVYLREAYSPLWGFLYGWTLFLVIQTGTIAAVGVAFAKFLGVLVPALGTDPKAGARVLFEHWNAVPEFHFTGKAAAQGWLTWSDRLFQVTAGQGVAVGIVVLLTAVNCLGVREGKWVQNLFTVAKTLALGLLIVLGLTVAANPAVWQANTQDWWLRISETKRYGEVYARVPYEVLAALMVMGGAMVGALFSSDAWNNVTFTAGEVRNPRRNLPLSLILGTGTVILLYLLANLAYLWSLPLLGHEGGPTPLARGIANASDQRVGTAVMELAAPRFGAPLMAVGIMLSTFGCANGLILMGARLYYAMARDGLFFARVGKLNRNGVPAAGLALQAVWAVLLIFSGNYGQLLDYVIFAALLFYVLTVVGLFVLRAKRPAADRPYRALGYPILPALYVFLCAVVMVDLLFVKPDYTWPGLGIVATGIPVYFIWRWRSARAKRLD